MLGMTDFLTGVPPPRVFFARVANKGLMLDAASRTAGKGHEVGRFRVVSRQPVKAMNKDLSSGEDWREPIDRGRMGKGREGEANRAKAEPRKH